LTALPSSATDRLEGERRKCRALAILEARRRVYIRRGRRALLTRLLAAGEATADDVRAAVELPPAINPKCLGSVPGQLAEAGIIRAAGFVRTTRPAGHARPVLLWQLADRAAALAWLAAHPDLPDLEPAEGDPQQPTLWD
jgi:hypothetical protein